MKDLITAIASMIIIAVFLMQFAANQVTYTKVMAAEYNIRSFGNSSEKEGTIDSAGKEQLRHSLAEIMDCSPQEISMEFDCGNEGGTYEISMPLKNIIGAAQLLGIRPEENRGMHVSRGILVFEEKEEDEQEEEGEL